MMPAAHDPCVPSQVNLGQGLRKTIAYFDELLRREQRSAALQGSVVPARRIGGTEQDAAMPVATRGVRSV